MNELKMFDMMTYGALLLIVIGLFLATQITKGKDA